MSSEENIGHGRVLNKQSKHQDNTQVETMDVSDAGDKRAASRTPSPVPQSRDLSRSPSRSPSASPPAGSPRGSVDSERDSPRRSYSRSASRERTPRASRSRTPRSRSPKRSRSRSRDRAARRSLSRDDRGARPETSRGRRGRGRRSASPRTRRGGHFRHADARDFKAPERWLRNLFEDGLKETLETTRLPCNVSKINDCMRRLDRTYHISETGFPTFAAMCYWFDEMSGLIEVRRERDSVMLLRSKMERDVVCRPRPSSSRRRGRREGRSDRISRSSGRRLTRSPSPRGDRYGERGRSDRGRDRDRRSRSPARWEMA